MNSRGRLFYMRLSQRSQVQGSQFTVNSWGWYEFFMSYGWAKGQWATTLKSFRFEEPLAKLPLEAILKSMFYHSNRVKNLNLLKIRNFPFSSEWPIRINGGLEKISVNFARGSVVFGSQMSGDDYLIVKGDKTWKRAGCRRGFLKPGLQWDGRWVVSPI